MPAKQGSGPPPKAGGGAAEEDFAHLVFRTWGVLHGSLFRALGPGPDLGRPELGLLGYLHARGSSTVSEAAEACRMAKSQLSLNVERLVEKGYVSRERDEGDRRVMRIAATRRGLRALDEAFAEVRERVEAFFAPLDAGELEQLRAAFLLIASLAEADTAPGGGVSDKTTARP